MKCNPMLTKSFSNCSWIGTLEKGVGIICGGDGSGSAGDAIVETVFLGLLGFLLILEKSSSLGIEGGVT